MCWDTFYKASWRATYACHNRIFIGEPHTRGMKQHIPHDVHTDPTIHPSSGETWLHELTDHVLTYDLVDSDIQDVRMMEDEEGAFLTKGLYDYSCLLSQCAEQYTPYIAIFEDDVIAIFKDDVIAMDGWFHRTVDVIREVER